jgi:hypothetical protein
VTSDNLAVLLAIDVLGLIVLLLLLWRLFRK